MPEKTTGTNPNLLAPNLKKILSRLVIFYAVANLAILPLAFPCLQSIAAVHLTTPQLVIVHILPPTSVLVHSLFRLWKFDYWLHIFEILYSLLEIAGLTMSLVLPFVFKYFRSTWNTFAPDIIQAILSIVLIVLCAASLGVVLWDIRTEDQPFEALLKPYDFFKGNGDQNHIHRHHMFGSTPWKTLFSKKEHVLIRSIRGGVAVFCLFFLGLLALYALLARPSNLLSVPHRILFRSFWYPSSTERPTIPMGAIIVLPEKYTNIPSLNGIVNITVAGQPTNSVCEVQQSRLALNATIISCVLENENQVLESKENIYTVDFSHIPESPQSRIASFYLWRKDEGISVEDVLEGTEPTVLIPGAQIFGTLLLARRELMTSIWTTALAIPHRRQVNVANVRSVIPDPSIPGPRNDRVASLRIHLLPIQPNLLIEQATPDDTLLEGFALLGGVWTTVNGLFALTFGSTLLLVLFGIKPLSVYGLIHMLPGQRHDILDIERGDLAKDDEEQARIVAALKYHLLDVENTTNVQESNTEQAKNVTQKDLNGSREPLLQNEKVLGREESYDSTASTVVSDESACSSNVGYALTTADPSSSRG